MRVQCWLASYLSIMVEAWWQNACTLHSGQAQRCCVVHTLKSLKRTMHFAKHNATYMGRTAVAALARRVSTTGRGTRTGAPVPSMDLEKGLQRSAGKLAWHLSSHSAECWQHSCCTQYECCSLSRSATVTSRAYPVRHNLPLHPAQCSAQPSS